ncbi:MAG TPA: CHASE2 domain-containing protein, partial [Geminicoccaceae bacterium]|nr:CHASE2 domain-containing protein [Geminicoccaceae bacterium]
MATLGLCLVYGPLSRTAAVQQIEAQLLDLRFRLRPDAPPSDQIVLVLIDDRSIREIGRWPWSRGIMADALTWLNAAGARTIGLDLLFAEPEPAAVPGAWLERLRAGLDALVAEGASGIDPETILQRLLDDLSGDPALAATMHTAGNVVLPYSFGFGEPIDAAPAAPPPAVAMTAFRVVHGLDRARARLPMVATSLLAPIPELAGAAASLGHTNVRLDRDGAARFEFPAVAYGSEIYPSFALEVARAHLGVPREKVRLELDRGVWLGDRLVPTDE